jgi:hypothetical protein
MQSTAIYRHHKAEMEKLLPRFQNFIKEARNRIDSGGKEGYVTGLWAA